MERRADTPTRISRRKYEETHKEKRQEQNKVWGTSIPRKDAEAIDEFLKTHFLHRKLPYNHTTRTLLRFCIYQ